MPQYDFNHINSWLDKAAEGKPSEYLASLFGETLKEFSSRASHSLNSATLMAILKSVVQQSAEVYPVLNNIKIDNEGLSFIEWEKQCSHYDPNEISKAFHFLLNELFNVLSDLTADILPAALDNGKGEIHDSALIAQRLENLFDISKIFAGFSSAEETLSKVFLILGNSIPFQSIFLIENHHCECLTTVWHNENTTDEQISRAYHHALEHYEYLVAPNSGLDVIGMEATNKHVLPRCSFNNLFGPDVETKFITIPLAKSSLQNFGMMQIECLNTVNEQDLKYVTAISNLLAITLDRFNKEEENEKQRHNEFIERTAELIEIHKYVKDLEAEREVREQFVSILTHDLRTPLTAAKMAAQIILKKPDRADKNTALADKIIFSVNRMDKMIKDLLDANRIRAGESLQLNMELCDLRKIATETLRDLSSTYGDRFILFANREAIQGYWNEEGLRRVLENLLNNAIKYGGNLQPILLSIKSFETQIEIVVHNFGNPIPTEDQESLFQPFHRSRAATKGEKKGWGLGLTLVRGVAEAHGGNVKVHSNEKEGTSFIVTIARDARPYQEQLH